MNFFEAANKKKEEDKIRRKSWPKDRYHEFRYYGDKGTVTNFEDLFANDWEIIKQRP